MEYPKIVTVFERDPETKFRTLIEGQFTRPDFAYLSGNQWRLTEKIDGTNIRVEWLDGRRTFRGRTDRAQIPPFLSDKLGELFPVETFAESYPDQPIILYGEGYGARIQKGGGSYIADGTNFILFDVLVGDVWLEWENVQAVADHLGIDVVPEVGIGSLARGIEMAREGFQSSIGSQVAEGLVMRPLVNLFDRMGRRVITKIKYRDFVR